MNTAYRTHLIRAFLAVFAGDMIWTSFTIYQIQVVGMSALQLVLVGSTLEVAILLCEIPTGVIADLFGRRLSVIIGYTLISAAYLLQGLFPFFWSIVLGHAIWGVGWTCLSGAYDAWLADELGTARLSDALLRGEQVARVAGLCGIAAGVALGLIGLRVPVFAGAAVFLGLAAWLALKMPETGFTPATHTQRASWRGAWKTFRGGLAVVQRRPVLLRLLGIAFFFGLFSEAWDRLWQAHFLQTFDIGAATGLSPVVSIGALRVGTLVLSLAATEWLRRRRNRPDAGTAGRAIFALTAVMILALLTYGLAPVLAVAVASFFTFTVARSLVNPLLNAWQNEEIDDSQVRATVLSMSGQSDAIGQLAGGAPLGLIGNRSLRAAFVVSSALLTPALVLLRGLPRRAR